MKKLWICLLALYLLAGCGAPAVQPERQPIQLPQEQEPVNDKDSSGDDAAVTIPQAQDTPAPAVSDDTVPPQQEQLPESKPEQPAAPEVNVENPPEQQPVAENPPPVPPEQAEITEIELTCTLEIRCDKLVGNPELDPDKVELIPEDGVLFSAVNVGFYEGESVFNVLQRTLKQNKQHLEFAQSPLYNSAYIEGICNLYAFDCGNLSGWMYRVNDWYPNYGCSQYVLQAGDVIVWDYTCDLGADLGVEDYSGNNQ